MANKSNRQDAQQTFRQFAWNLAGTLAQTGKTGKPAAPKSASRPGKR